MQMSVNSPHAIQLQAGPGGILAMMVGPNTVGAVIGFGDQRTRRRTLFGLHPTLARTSAAGRQVTWVRTPDDEDGGDFDEHPWSGADQRYRSRSRRRARDIPAEDGGTCEVIETDPIHRVANLQTWCSPRFKHGRPLESTIHELKEGLVDPLRHPKFILNAVKATVKRHGEQQELYWTEDHRRLFCMRAAGCNQIRVRIPFSDERGSSNLPKGH